MLEAHLEEGAAAEQGLRARGGWRPSVGRELRPQAGPHTGLEAEPGSPRPASSGGGRARLRLWLHHRRNLGLQNERQQRLALQPDRLPERRPGPEVTSPQPPHAKAWCGAGGPPGGRLRERSSPRDLPYGGEAAEGAGVQGRSAREGIPTHLAAEHRGRSWGRGSGVRRRGASLRGRVLKGAAAEDPGVGEPRVPGVGGG